MVGLSGFCACYSILIENLVLEKCAKNIPQFNVLGNQSAGRFWPIAVRRERTLVAQAV
jgi:hypothetical protein